MKNWIFGYFFLFFGVVNAQVGSEFVQTGYQKHLKNDYAGAIIDYSKAIAMNPRNLDALYNRGACQMALNNLAAAKADFDQTLQINKIHGMAYYNRATILVLQGDYDGALMDINSAINYEPNIGSAYTLRGQLVARLGNIQAACADFARAKQLKDSDADQYLKEYCGK